MTAAELVADLIKRSDKEVNELAYVYNPAIRVPRIEGTIDGMRRVKEWLQEYDTSAEPWTEDDLDAAREKAAAFSRLLNQAPDPEP